jgi:peptidyl-prolyl cis-trans isomerase B (cyclophilin B)
LKRLVLILWVLLSGIGLGSVEEESELAAKQAVLKTDRGTIILDLYPKAAPNHVAAFQKRIREGFYVGTTFHRVIRFGIIQGGDPFTRDLEKKGQYGQGGLFELKAESKKLPHKRGAVAAVLVPGEPDSAGSQFFICVTDQVQLDGKYTVFGRVAGGMDVVEEISQLPTDDQQHVTERVEITATAERDRPPPEVLPFSETPDEELANYRVNISTNLGDIELTFLPELAPAHVRRFLQFAELGLYDGTIFHRVVPFFVIQGGAMSSRKTPFPEKYTELLTPLKAEFSDRPHVRGILSMARGDDPDGAVDSFFIVLEPQESLDGNYTVFGTVARGIDTVDGISQVPTLGEQPVSPVRVSKMTVTKIAGR